MPFGGNNKSPRAAIEAGGYNLSDDSNDHRRPQNGYYGSGRSANTADGGYSNSKWPPSNGSQGNNAAGGGYGGGSGGFSSYNNKSSNNRGYQNQSYGSKGNAMDTWGSGGGGDQDWASYKAPAAPSGEIRKNFYTPSPNKWPKAELDQYLKDNEIVIHGKDVPEAIQAVADTGVTGPLFSTLQGLGFVKPTCIQAVGWPIALSGRDLIGIARTGSGKTLGYALPALVHVLNQPKIRQREGPVALIMAPTRELAQQIQQVIHSLSTSVQLKCVCFFGGAPKWSQLREMDNGIEIVVATPGRLNDFLESGKVNLKRCSFVVLDEADRMLDMGFEPQIRKIIGQINPNRQTMMFSATWPKEVKALAEDFFKDPVQINVGSLNLCANHNIQQIVDVVDERDKENKLWMLIDEIGQEKENKTIIFAETKRKVDHLTRELQGVGWAAQCIHGDKTQGERDQTLLAFRQSRATILVATDVAARGLDVDDIKFVVNFDYPTNSEDYIHRIGRTGRANKAGTAYTFFTQKNGKQAGELVGVLREAKQPVPPKLLEIQSTWGSNGGSRFGNGRPRYRTPGYGGGSGGRY